MKAHKIKLLTPAEIQAERIDKFLATRLEHFSRNRIQQLIDDRLVLVEGQPIKSSFILSPAQTIEITVPPPQESRILPEAIDLDVLFEDEHLLVVNKPAGMVVHPAFGHASGTLVNALLHRCSDLSGINGEMRPGIVHRLDKETSGLLVVAKSDGVHRHLSDQFSKRSIGRSYFAVLWGHLQHKTGRIETHYGRSPKNRKKMAVLESGKLAITTYRVVEEWPLLSQVFFRLETGRTHQIRVHAAHIGHPVLSDTLYGGRNKKLTAHSQRQRGIALGYLQCLSRQALHAHSLSFQHPVSLKKIDFTAAVPADLARLFALARQYGEDAL